MLTTKITIDASEFTSYTAAAAPVIDTGNDDVATGDLIAVDVDVAGTGAKGLGVDAQLRCPDGYHRPGQYPADSAHDSASSVDTLPASVASRQPAAR